MFVSPVRLLSVGAVLLTAAAGQACAAAALPASPVAAAFGNTIVTTYPDGRTQQIWLQPDGRWSGVSRTHKDLAGKWRLKGDKVCLRQQTPPTLPFSYCTVFPPDARVGAAWTSKDFGGTPIQLRLVGG